MSPKWLSSLVRARQIQQDAAQQRFAEAERSVRSATAKARREDQRLDDLVIPTDEVAVPAFIAAAVALQAAAATHAAARTAAQHAVTRVDEHRAVLHAASIASDSAEELQQRALSVECERAARAGQRDLDEIAAGIHRRRSESAQ